MNAKMQRSAALKLIAAVGMCSAAPLVSAGAKAPAPDQLNNQFFDWTVNAQPAPANYLPSPFLTDDNAVQVIAQQPVGVKVQGPISDATASQVFDNTSVHISYVFGDLEGNDAISQAATLAAQVRGTKAQSNNSATLNWSGQAYVGNFGFTAIKGVDPTTPNGYQSKKGTHSFAGWGNDAYHAANLTMSNADLYPGDPSFRTPAAGNSSAPNIRSALFTLPVWRLSLVTRDRSGGDLNIPYVSDFNNWGNDALNNAPGTQGFQYFWTNPTHDQMLSDRDFAALVAHYRLRGADSFHLFETGTLGKSQADLQTQAREGWTESHINSVMSAADRVLLLSDGNGGGTNLLGTNTDIIEDGVSKNIEQAGALYSGAYSLSQGKLDVLISNMDQGGHKLTLPANIGGYALSTKDFTLGGGTHLLVEYNLTGSGKSRQWTTSVGQMQTPFSDLSDDRNKQGVPEPATISFFSVVGMFALTRRRPRQGNL